GEANVAVEGLPGPRKRLRRDRLAEPDDPGSSQTPTYGAARRELLERIVVAPRGRRSGAAGDAGEIPERTVEPAPVLRPRALVEAVHVLRDQRDARNPAAPRREHLVRAVGPGLRDEVAAPRIPLPHRLRIAGEGLRRRELFGSKIPPETAGAAKRR